MKAIFNPAIYLFNKCHLFIKFLLISSVLILLLGIAAFQYLSSVNSYISFNSKEVIGTEYSMVTKNMLMQVLLYKASVRDTAASQATIEEKIEQTIKELTTLDKNNHSILDHQASEKEVSSDIAQCGQLWNTLKTTRTEEAFTALISQIMLLQTDISDNSNLTLDPDLDSYYCMDITMFRSFVLIKDLYDMKQMVEAVSTNAIDPTVRKNFIQLNTRMSDLTDTIASDMHTAYHFNHSKKHKSMEELPTLQDQVTTSMQDVITQIDTFSGRKDKEVTLNAIDTAIGINSAMYDTVDHMMMELIQIRVDDYNAGKTNFVIILLLALPVLVYIYIAFMMSITDNIKKINVGLEYIAEKNLTKRIDVNSNDELGSIGKGFNHMVMNIKNTLRSIMNASEKVSTSVEKVNGSIYRFDQKLKVITETIENLSGSTEELSSSTEEIEATSVSLKEAAGGMNEKAAECFQVAEDIDQKTKDVIQNMKASSNTMESLMQESEQKLMKSLEAAKAVDQIHLLSESIMQITKQTNLLALNASIEAARAGEAGKGFSVVAQEVRKLAEESNQTALKIQDVVDRISSSVKELSANSCYLLHFFKSTVLVEYYSVLNFCRDFSEDAGTFKEFSKNINLLSDRLSESIQTLVIIIGEMAKANTFSAAEIQNMVSDIIHMKKESEMIVTDILQVSDTMSSLEEESSKFIISA